MQIRRINLSDYRNFEHAQLSLGPRFTVLFGHNGAGKTNILEAIYFVSTLRSFRTTDASTLIRHDTDAAAIELAVYDDTLDLDRTFGVRLQRGQRSVRRTALADGKVVRTARDFYGCIQAVLFTPEDLGVLRGPPSGRRQFLDRILFARDRAHIGDIQRYEKLLRSRNHVLRHGNGKAADETELLATYEVGLAEVGARIWTRRTQLLDAFQGPFAEAFAAIHGSDGSQSTPSTDVSRTHLVYESRESESGSEEDRGRMLGVQLERRRAEDRRRGYTTVGPHRDDFRVDFDGRCAGRYASQGQARALVLAFKLAELKAARELRGTAPLLLLDDVSSELDPRRSALLFETLERDAGQCLLTTTAAHFVELPQHAAVCRCAVDEGRLEIRD